jgi:LPS export ABC transporter protein LptC
MKRCKSSSHRQEKVVASLVATGIAVFFLLVMLPSCKNDVQTVLSLDVVDTLPEMTARDIEILYSEKARVGIKLVSPLLVSKTLEEPVLLFPNGFTVYFYDSALTLTTTITAEYGISYEKKKLMEARNNVVVENLQKQEKLNTEELFWDRDKGRIYSNKFVRITSGGQVYTGDGLTSDQPFDELEVTNPKGLIEITEEPKK